MQIHVPFVACGIVSFNGGGQLCLQIVQGEEVLSNETRMSTIQSRRPQKEATKAM